MHNRFGKVFQNVQTGEIKCFSYAPQQDYCGLVRNTAKMGYRQRVLTSSVMISIMGDFLSKHNALVTGIEFLTEDIDLRCDINNLLGKMKNNGAYWGALLVETISAFCLSCRLMKSS